MPGKERSMLRIAIVAAMALCGASAYGEGDLAPTNDLPNPFQIYCAVGRSSCGEDMGSAERGRDRQRWKIRLGGESVRRESRYSSR